MSPQSTSHDPHYDHSSVLILVAIAGITLVGVLGFFGAFKVRDKDKPPEKAYTIDGCDVYRFTERGNVAYFARCGERVSTTFANYASGQNHIITDKK